MSTNYDGIPKSWGPAWIRLGGDMNWEDYGGTWARKGKDGVWYVLQFENMEDMCGSDHEPSQKYIASVRAVDLRGVGESGALTSALRSCGWTVVRLPVEESPSGMGIDTGSGDVESDPEIIERMMVDACNGYGAYAPLDEEFGGSYPLRVRNAARLIADGYATDGDAPMDKVVNKIGSTAREYMTGDLWSALRRNQGDPTVDLVRKMYGACETTLGGEPIPGDIR